jgi:seryl-tRNA synthetase
MLHISDLRNNKEQIISSLKIKNFDAKNLVNSAIAKDDERKAIQQKSDDLLSQQNKIAKEIGVLYKTGKVEKASDLKQQSIKNQKRITGNNIITK